MNPLILFFVASAGDTISMAEIQRAAGALVGADQACLELGEPYSTLAERYLERHKTVLVNWGEYQGASGLFSFKTPGTARAAKEYMEQSGVKTDVYNFFNELALAQRLLGEIPLVSGGALKVKVGAHYYLKKDKPTAFNLIQTMAQVYGISWPPKPGLATAMPPDIYGKTRTVKNWVKAVEGIYVPPGDTAYVSLLKTDFKARVRTAFSVGCDLLFSYFSADSLYRAYAQDSPYPAMASALMDSLSSEAVKFKEYLTVAQHVFEPKKDTLITNPDGTQVYTTLPEKKGTMWEFLKEYLPSIASSTSAAMQALGVSVP